jgi:hypothetical protein
MKDIGRRVANDRAPTLEEIKKLLEYPDRRIKPLVLITMSSGIRIDAWNWLQLKHVTPLGKGSKPVSSQEEVAAAKLVVYAGEPEQYFSFITPEAYTSLMEWMNYRKQNGESIGPESWLMRDIWAFRYLGAAERPPEKLSTFGVKKLLDRAVWEQGLRRPLDGARRHEFKAAHGFRKYFKTNAETAGMLPIHVET